MITAPKHTPGPWHVDESYSESGVLTSLGIHSSHGAVPATFENAYLMAAAPEMLIALKRATDALQELAVNNPGVINAMIYNAIIDAKAAIAKAEGRAEL